MSSKLEIPSLTLLFSLLFSISLLFCVPIALAFLCVMWQIGVLNWKPCTFWPFSGVSSFCSHSHLEALFVL